MLRAAAAAGEAGFPVIQIVAVGRIVKEGETHFLIAGEDRFRVLEPQGAAAPLPDNPETVMKFVASIDDRENPVLVKIVRSDPYTAEDRAADEKKAAELLSNSKDSQEQSQEKSKPEESDELVDFNQ